MSDIFKFTPIQRLVRMVRSGYGLSQKDLGKMFGVCKTEVLFWEMGASTPSDANVVYLWELLYGNVRNLEDCLFVKEKS